MHFEDAAQTGNDAIDHGQSETAALAGRLGREEGIVDSFQHIGCHALAVIGHRHANSLEQPRRSGLYAACRIDRNTDGAGAIHGMGGIDAQVHHDLNDLSWICSDDPVACVHAALEVEFDARLQGATKQRQCFAHCRDDIHGNRLTPSLACEFEDLCDQIAGTKTAAQDLPDVVLGRGIRGQLIPDHFRKTHDATQDVIEVVGDAGRERPNGLQLARLHPGIVFLVDTLLGGPMVTFGRRVEENQRGGALRHQLLEMMPVFREFVLLFHGRGDILDQQHGAALIGAHQLDLDVPCCSASSRNTPLRWYDRSDSTRRCPPGLCETGLKMLQHLQSIGNPEIEIEVAQKLHGFGIEHFDLAVRSQSYDCDRHQIQKLEEFLDLTCGWHVISPQGRRMRRYIFSWPTPLSIRRVTGSSFMRKAKT